MVLIKRRQELPSDILSKLEKANCFFGKEYVEYAESDGDKVWFVYDESRIIPIQTKSDLVFFSRGIFLSEPYVYSETEKTEKLFLDDVVRLFKENKNVDYFLETPTHGLFEDYPTDSIRIGFGNYVLRINADDDQIFSTITSKHRNMIRRGEKSGVLVKIGGMDLLEDYLAVDRATWERNNKPIDNSMRYKKMLEMMPNMTFVSIAYKDNTPQCGILGFYNKVMAYYMFGASKNKPEPGSTHFLQWKTIQFLRDSGVKAYNFVGCRLNEDPESKYHAIQHFKKGFGGTLIEGYMFKTILNSSKYKAMNFLKMIKYKQVATDIIDQELSKWEDINV